MKRGKTDSKAFFVGFVYHPSSPLLTVSPLLLPISKSKKLSSTSACASRPDAGPTRSSASANAPNASSPEISRKDGLRARLTRLSCVSVAVAVDDPERERAMGDTGERADGEMGIVISVVVVVVLDRVSPRCRRFRRLGGGASAANGTSTLAR